MKTEKEGGIQLSNKMLMKKDMKVKLISVDWGSNSSAGAFKTAAMLAVSKLGKSSVSFLLFFCFFSFLFFFVYFNLGMKSGPAILEPVMALEISVDEHYVGVVLSDLNRRRGKFPPLDLIPSSLDLINITRSILSTPNTSPLCHTFHIKGIYYVSLHYIHSSLPWRELPINICFSSFFLFSFLFFCFS